MNWINVWFEPHDVVQRPNSVDNIVRSFQRGITAVAEAHETIIGFVTALRRDPEVLDIINLYVEDPYRKRGVGSSLLDALEEQARASHFETLISIASASFYPGKPLPERLYKRLNYEVVHLTADSQLYLKRFSAPQPPDTTAQPRRIRISSIH